MNKIRGEFAKGLLVVLIVCCFNFNYARADSNQFYFNSLNFKQIERDLFLQNGSKSLKINRSTVCSDEMIEIKNGLANSSVWATNLVESWGEIPSNISSAYSYEFGAFAQCLSIERNGQHYKTQYCMGQLVLEPNTDRESMNIPDPIRDGTIDLEDLEFLLPQPDKGVAINFGLCLPDACSLRAIEPILDDLIQQKGNNAIVKLFEHTCQFEESVSELRTIDLVAIVFFGLVFCLIVASTCYDIACDLQKRSKTQLCLAFSFYSNGKKLFSCQKSESPDTVGCLHGIRSISAIFIVLFHTFDTYKSVAVENPSSFRSFITGYQSIMIYLGLLAVDTFFVLSGFLLSISLLKQFKKNGRINVPMLYFHRYIRLTPMLGVCMLLIVSLFRFAGSGPLWPRVNDVHGTAQCEKYWWLNLLYVQNYVNSDDMCNDISWYLAVDMQLFLIAPAIVYSIHRFKTKAIYGLSGLVLVCIGLTLAVHVNYQIHNAEEIWSLSYYPTHIRYSPWLIGVITGYFHFATQNGKVSISKILNLLAWTISLASMAVISIVNHQLVQPDSEATPLQCGLYYGLSRVVWSIALSNIIFACAHGFGGPINWFLAHSLWHPISRLSYSIYIMHFFAIRRMVSVKTSVHFTELSLLYAFLSNFVVTFLVSVVATLAFETPVMIIERELFKKDPKQKPNESQGNNVKLQQPKEDQTIPN